MPTKQKTYTEEFKREAVRLAQERGNIAQTARDLGVSDSSILYWKKQLEEVPQNPFPGQGNPRDTEMAQLQRENARLKEENEIRKKSRGYLYQPPPMRYPFIKQHEGQYSVSALCRVMQVARSGYYAWCKRAPSPTEQANQQLTQKIKTVFEASDQTYGSPRIYEELKEQQVACSQKRIARLMRLADLKAVLPKRFVVTTHSNHALPVAGNLLDRQFGSETPNTRWTADISYVWTAEGWMYLAVVLDLFSRRIVGWAMGTTLERSLVLSALSMALHNRHPEAGLLCHSDRGSQYASGDYQQALSDAGIVCSMSRKGNCWDNAPTESFFSTLKRECVYRHRFATRSEARTVLFTWIEVWYNRKRRHSSLGYLSPDAFEQKHSQPPSAHALAA